VLWNRSHLFLDLLIGIWSWRHEVCHALPTLAAQLFPCANLRCLTPVYLRDLQLKALDSFSVLEMMMMMNVVVSTFIWLVTNLADFMMCVTIEVIGIFKLRLFR
jgi:hypothetical protein